MKILVTGGMGFIGTNFLKYMLDKYPDYKFVCLDNLSVEDSRKNLKDFNEYRNFKFIKDDITNENSIDKIFETEKFDIVINFAAEVAVDYSIENPNIFLKTNVLGTAILMNACLKYNVLRFHQISTDEVYGDLQIDSTIQYDESAQLKPSNPYAASKASADLLVLSYYRTYGLNVTISRSTNNYGPHQSFRALIPLTIKNCIQNKKIPIFGKGDNIRDWVYVLDHVKAIDLILHHGKIGHIYNICGKSKKNNLYVVNKILKLMNKDQNLISFVEDRPGHDVMYSINSNKIENELNWKRKYSFDDGIKETIKWYINKF
ncbi:MAG: dTDP-glucose 4,6-dehydratase [Bacilli bacterium]|nr:dTDP-glucose 4,6-dehydratase [Bacilli bacterium]